MWCTSNEGFVYIIVDRSSRFILDKRGAKGSLCVHKEYASTSEPMVLQTTVMDITTHAPEYQEKSITLDRFFAPKSQCFVMSPPHYGSLAEVRRVGMMIGGPHNQAQIRLHVYQST